jgi:8-oxo-dGTP pyrophosphatase MutT (NUDIX family)
MKWILTNQEDLLSTVPFTVQRLSLVDRVRGPLHDFHRLRAPDWANILPITREGEALLIRQPRAGAMELILESPGGAVDAAETDPLVAAARELEEETGYTSERMTHIASFNPNPALFSNKIHFFLAEGCFINPNREHFPDSSEDIEIVLVPLDELEERVARGEINHALAALGIMLSLRRLKSGN